MEGRRFGFASGILSSINAALPAVKTFQQITPSHLRHIPPAAKDISNRSAVFYVHPTGSPHSQMQDFKGGREGSFIGKTEPPSHHNIRKLFP